MCKYIFSRIIQMIPRYQDFNFFSLTVPTHWLFFFLGGGGGAVMSIRNFLIPWEIGFFEVLQNIKKKFFHQKIRLTVVCRRSLDYSREKKVVWHNGWEPVTLGHLSAKIFGNRSCGRGDRTFPVCHFITCGYLITDHMTLWVQSPHPISPIPIPLSKICSL